MKNYAVSEAGKVLSFKALIEDVKALSRSKLLMDERIQGSLGVIETLSREFMEEQNTKALYEVWYNFRTDELKHKHPNGKYETDVTEEQFLEMQADDNIEVVHYNKFDLTTYENLLIEGE